AVRMGASANLCDALHFACNDLADDQSLELSIAFAPALFTDGATQRTWRFTHSDRDYLIGLRQSMRESAVDDNFHLYGFVHSVKDSGQVYLATILAWIREKVAQVTVRFDEDQGKLVSKAYAERIAIECYGRLLERRQAYTLDRPH